MTSSKPYFYEGDSTLIKKKKKKGPDKEFLEYIPRGILVGWTTGVEKRLQDYIIRIDWKILIV